MIISDKPSSVTSTNQPIYENMYGSENFRIPGIAVTKDGKIAICCDVRWDDEQDCGGIDISCSVSCDSGKNWYSDFAVYMGDNGNRFDVSSTSIMDPEIICDGEKIYILADLFPSGLSSQYANFTLGEYTDKNGNIKLKKQGDSEYNYVLIGNDIVSVCGEKTGYTVDSHLNLIYDGEKKSNIFFSDCLFTVYPTNYLVLVTSDDYGKSWSGYRLLKYKKPDEDFLGSGCGHGIVASKGALVFTLYTRETACLLVSYDKGESFTRYDANCPLSETRVVELNDGTLRMFGRNFKDRIAYTDFTLLSDGSYIAEADMHLTSVPCCSNCNLGVVKTEHKGKEYIFVSAPSVVSTWQGRYRGRIFVFTLNGHEMEYLKEYEISGDNDFFAYSDLALLDSDTIGIVYEDSCIRYMNKSHGRGKSGFVFEKINIEELV